MTDKTIIRAFDLKEGQRGRIVKWGGPVNRGYIGAEVIRKGDNLVYTNGMGCWKDLFILPDIFNEDDKLVKVELLPDESKKPSYINDDIKNVSEVDLKAALKKVNDKNEESSRAMGLGISEALRGGPDTLVRYLRRAHGKQQTEFRIVVAPDGTAYAHILDRDSETLDFNIYHL